MILNEYISLPFSYMTFVIQYAIENKENQDHAFDPTPYNYIMDKRTAFLDLKFM